MQDDLGDRMKLYEGLSPAAGRFIPLLPVVARIDGRAFSSFTRGLDRPYDKSMASLMVMTTASLVEGTNARIGYTQSDEITLVWEQADFKSEPFFGGKVYKTLSILAAAATAAFNHLLPAFLPGKVHHLNQGLIPGRLLETPGVDLGPAARGLTDRLPLFDCRAFNMPSRIEVVNCLRWREMDAVRNSLQSAAHSCYSDTQLHGKGAPQLHELLHAKGINWNDYPAFFKRGTYVQRTQAGRRFTPDEIARLPPRHAAHTNPNLVVLRSKVQILELPPISRLANPESVIFEGAEPITVNNPLTETP